MVKKCKILQVHDFMCNAEAGKEVDDEGVSCGICGIKWGQFASTCDGIKCHCFGRWHCDLCVGAQSHK
jgi:hypothetical protein